VSNTRVAPRLSRASQVSLFSSRITDGREYERLNVPSRPLPAFPLSPSAAEVDPLIVPTVGFSAPIRKRMHGHEVVFYDLGGGSRIRGVWPSYFADVHGIIYVVDSADPGRLEESKEELHQALLHPMVVGKPVLM
jgi:GTPase SAR1 family protein